MMWIERSCFFLLILMMKSAFAIEVAITVVNSVYAINARTVRNTGYTFLNEILRTRYLPNPPTVTKFYNSIPEEKFLTKYTPCHGMNVQELAYALGIVHVELIVIHPFREGNGRVARILANLMALQAGKNMLDYTIIDKTINKQGFNNYIQGIQEGFDENYSRIINIFKQILEQST